MLALYSQQPHPAPHPPPPGIMYAAGHYGLVIMGWGEDQAPSQQGGEEAKLAAILGAIKAKSPQTKTFAYCGQFEGIVAAYSAQLKVVHDPAYKGFLLHGDDGKPIGGALAAVHVWDFRNASARQYLAEQVAGYFARAPGVDGVLMKAIALHATTAARRTRRARRCPTRKSGRRGLCKPGSLQPRRWPRPASTPSSQARTRSRARRFT